MSGQTVDDDVSIRIDERLAQFSGRPSDCSIFKVHNQLRRENEKAYEPEILAIGPYHHGKKNLQAMEEHKLYYLQLLLNRRNETSVDRYVMAIRGLEERARRCYSEAISLNEDEFVEMMILDGFFIIELIRKQDGRPEDVNDPIFQMCWMRTCVFTDLLLFENQLPFFVLVELFNMTSDPETPGIIFLALSFFNLILYEITTLSTVEIDNVKHLLGLVHHNFSFSFTETMSQRRSGYNQTNWDPIISATELQEVGIEFKKAEGSSNLLDIKFINGVMEIPTLEIAAETDTIYRNLIAYEQYPPVVGRRCFTDYFFIMYCLVNSVKDVKLLRSCGIFNIANDEWICNMIDKIIGSAHFSSDFSFCYSELCNNVNIHCRRRRNKWMANLWRTYFNSPWALISFLAAIVLLLLTIIQTVFSIIPNV